MEENTIVEKRIVLLLLLSLALSLWAEDSPVRAELVACVETAAVGGKITAPNVEDAELRRILSTVQIAADMTALASSTADKVLVLHDDSDWGTGGPCWFEKSAAWRTYGYKRSDGSFMYPIPDQALLAESNAPKEQLLDILNTWMENLNVHHGASYNNDLFSTQCTRDGDNLFEIDCSAFVSAILLGITYDNSRYVLGESADNIEKPFMGNYLGPSKSQYMPKGGLNASEMAMWFAQQKRLYELPLDQEKVRDTLQFGDIIFGSNSSSASRAYYNIEHVMFVLGVSGHYVITAESVSSVNPLEQQNLRAHYHVLTCDPSAGTGSIGPDKYFRVFARPDYQNLV